ncbi:MAG: hypothetical protein ACLFTR_05310 [Candidatus Woesearchaeota archaeon]
MNERLRDWAVGFLKHKDTFRNNLKDIENTENGFIAHFKDKDERYIIQENLDFENIPKNENVCFVTLNNQKNFNKLLAEWKIIVMFKHLTIIFVEKIADGKHWVVNPHIHDRISDKSSLKPGLKSLFESAKGN